MDIYKSSLMAFLIISVLFVWFLALYSPQVSNTCESYNNGFTIKYKKQDMETQTDIPEIQEVIPNVPNDSYENIDIYCSHGVCEKQYDEMPKIELHYENGICVKSHNSKDNCENGICIRNKNITDEKEYIKETNIKEKDEKTDEKTDVNKPQLFKKVIDMGDPFNIEKKRNLNHK